MQVFKKDIIPHYQWNTHEVFRNGRRVFCHNRGPRNLIHHTRKKTFTFQTDVIELYWFREMFSLHIALDRDTRELHYYANIHALPSIGRGRIGFVDYDLDVIRLDTARAEIIDWDDFERHSRLYGYGESLMERVPREAERMKDLLDRAPLFQKEKVLESFASLDRGERDLPLWEMEL